MNCYISLLKIIINKTIDKDSSKIVSFASYKLIIGISHCFIALGLKLKQTTAKTEKVKALA